MAYAVAAIVKKDGKPYVDMGPVKAAPAGTFFWVSLTTHCLNSDSVFCPSAVVSVFLAPMIEGLRSAAS